MADNETISRPGTNWYDLFIVVVTLFFIVLKVNPGGYLDSEVETWSWWLVLAPLWIWWVLFLGILAVAGIVLGVAFVLDKLSARKRRKLARERFNKQIRNRQFRA